LIEVDEASIKREKDAARELRKSRWWQNLIQKTNCYYCGKEISGKQVSMDHIVPISRGGRSTKGNIAPSCKACNTKKKDQTASELL
jgi:5-methylcytosine-specific restriction endonuclease McrA